jgi:hypothetical protein
LAPAPARGPSLTHEGGACNLAGESGIVHSTTTLTGRLWRRSVGNSGAFPFVRTRSVDSGASAVYTDLVFGGSEQPGTWGASWHSTAPRTYPLGVHLGSQAGPTEPNTLRRLGDHG